MVSASHYRDLLREERTAIAGLCDKWQSVLNDSDKGSCLPDDVCGKIQIAIGEYSAVLTVRGLRLGLGPFAVGERGTLFQIYLAPSRPALVG